MLRDGGEMDVDTATSTLAELDGIAQSVARDVIATACQRGIVTLGDGETNVRLVA
jgi:hypothetical protein